MRKVVGMAVVEVVVVGLTVPPAANLGLETRTDRGNSTAGTARSALDKGESLLSSQGGVGRLAHAAQHVCRRVPPKHILNVLCLEPTLDRQRTSTRKRTYTYTR